MKEKLQEYALFAEIVGGLAIVASLIFVGVQINQNNLLLEAQARFNHKETRAQSSVFRTENPAMVNAMLKARKGEPLTDTDMFYIERLSDYIFTSWDWEYQEATRGNIELPRSAYAGFFRNDPYTINIWNRTKAQYSEGFRSFMDDLLNDL